jgi:hypothetical protein
VIFLINGTLSLSMVTGMRNPLLAVAEPDGVRLWLVQGAHVQCYINEAKARNALTQNFGNDADATTLSSHVQHRSTTL